MTTHTHEHIRTYTYINEHTTKNLMLHLEVIVTDESSICDKLFLVLLKFCYVKVNSWLGV